MMGRRLFYGLLCMSVVMATSCREENQSADPMDSGVELDDNPKTVELNPEHGEPGHVCEIPVGAPLDGSLSLEKMLNGNKGGNPSVPSDKSPVEVNQRPETNPPHGQPFHDCNIPVGAPLTA